MTTEQEEKVLKVIGLFTFFVFVPLNAFIIKDLGLKFLFIVPLLFLYTFLYYRKYIRDKKEGKDISRYKRLLFFVGISFLIFIFFLFYPML
jgi:4-hydroxybenzoate polyprenyltransferase